LYFKHPE
ncbi:unnamed protein product, partial [Allacma fusca]